jgi:hypothetical protein
LSSKNLLKLKHNYTRVETMREVDGRDGERWRGIKIYFGLLVISKE